MPSHKGCDLTSWLLMKRFYTISFMISQFIELRTKQTSKQSETLVITLLKGYLSLPLIWNYKNMWLCVKLYHWIYLTGFIFVFTCFYLLTLKKIMQLLQAEYLLFKMIGTISEVFEILNGFKFLKYLLTHTWRWDPSLNTE